MLRPHAQCIPPVSLAVDPAGASLGRADRPTHPLGPFYKRWKQTHKPDPVNSCLRLGAPLMPFYTSCHHRRSVVAGVLPSTLVKLQG